MRVLITGVSGFVGRHLADFLRSAHPEVELFGLGRHALEGVCCERADLEQAEQVAAVLERVRPERIVHLAAQSSPQLSLTQPARTLSVNVQGLLNLLEALRRLELRPRLLVVGSGEEYGLAGADGRPLGEEAALRPLNPYAVSKVAQSYLALQYHLAYKLEILRTRTFNHTGPGRDASFAESSFASQLAEILGGRRPPRLEVGNLEAVRDFSDVRDVVRAYWALLERGRPGEVYNVCSGLGLRVGDVLDRLIRIAGIEVEKHRDASRLRPADIPALVGDPGRLQREVGWRRTFDLDRTLGDLLAYWRGKLEAAPAQARP